MAPYVLFVVICLIASTAWYTVYVKDSGDVDGTMDVWFVSSYVMWVTFVMAGYLLIGIWCTFAESLRSAAAPGMMTTNTTTCVHRVLPWTTEQLAIAFVLAFAGFALATYVFKSRVLKKKSEMTVQRVRKSFVPSAQESSAIASNFTKGFVVTLPGALATMALITQRAIGTRTTGT